MTLDFFELYYDAKGRNIFYFTPVGKQSQRHFAFLGESFMN